MEATDQVHPMSLQKPSVSLKNVTDTELVSALSEVNEWMGRLLSADDLIALATIVRRWMPNEDLQYFKNALYYGGLKVEWVGRLSGMAIAKFVREYDKHMEERGGLREPGTVKVTKPWMM